MADRRNYIGTGARNAGEPIKKKVKEEKEIQTKHDPKVDQKPEEQKVVLVIGATGRIGKEVVARLVKSGNCTVRAAVLNLAKSDELKNLGAHELVRFGYTEPETWGAALAGVDCICSADPDFLSEHHIEFSDRLGTLGKQIKHVVRVSCMGAETNTARKGKDKHVTKDGAETPLMKGEKCPSVGLSLTELRISLSMDQLITANVERMGWFGNPLGNIRNSFVSPNDIAEAAAVCLLEGPEKHENRFYDITGPKPQSMVEIAEVLCKVMGQKVEYRLQKPGEFERDFGRTRALLFKHLCKGSSPSPDFCTVTGRQPESYEDYLKNKGMAGVTGLEELCQTNLSKTAKVKATGNPEAEDRKLLFV